MRGRKGGELGSEKPLQCKLCKKKCQCGDPTTDLCDLDPGGAGGGQDGRREGTSAVPTPIPVPK